MYALVILLLLSVLIDYIMTFTLNDESEIVKYENSRILIHAMENGLLVPYVISVMFAYLIFALAVLKLSKGNLRKFSYITILTLSASHMLAWTTWIFRNPLYASIVLMMPIFALALLTVASGTALISELLKKCP